MTRINLISVEELSDQHLMSEYRELPRIVNGVLEGKFKSKNIPQTYILGKGHIIFFTNKLLFLTKRYQLIFDELKYRGFNLCDDFNPSEMYEKLKKYGYFKEEKYIFSQEEIMISRNRIIEKVKKKPLWYKWTRRQRPSYSII